MSRRRLVTAGVAAVVIAAGAIVAIVVMRSTPGSGPHGKTTAGTSATAPTTATVVRTDLAETTPVSGTVGFAGASTIVQPADTSPQAATAASGPQSDTGFGSASRYTVLPAVGDVIHPGQSLWSVDGQPVPVVPGTLIAWRPFRAGMTDGSDVAALDQALIALGDGGDLAVANAFTDATAAAIDRLQGSLGLPQTGSLALGSVVFAPAAVRVTAVHPLLGSPVVGGQPVLDVTSTTSVVNVALPVGQTRRVKVGDPVSVNLPDGSIATGTITTVGTVATNTTPSNSANGATSATVNVSVSLTNATAAGSLDQAPVTVNITNASARHVLAVPTTALLAVAAGGYALEVVGPDGAHRLVGVTTGIFDDQSGMVQVSGTALEAGQRVVIAA